MEIFIEKQLAATAYSFILGLIFGGLYDIIRITHILCGIASYAGEFRGMKRGLLPFFLFFLGDTAFALTVTASFSAFLYWQMNGRFRWFLLVAAIAGFAAYYHTAGRIVMAFSEAITRFLRLAATWIFLKPAAFLLRLLLRIARFLCRLTLGRLFHGVRRTARAIRSHHIRQKFGKDAQLAVLHIKESS